LDTLARQFLNGADVGTYWTVPGAASQASAN
jgi:hypothetical protein